MNEVNETRRFPLHELVGRGPDYTRRNDTMQISEIALLRFASFSDSYRMDHHDATIEKYTLPFKNIAYSAVKGIRT